MRRRVDRVSLATLFFLLTSAVWAATPEVLKSQPGAGEVLTEKLYDVRIWFDELPEGAPSIVVVDDAGNETQVRAVHSMGEQDLMGLVDGHLASGQYRLKWQAGDQQGEVPFSVALPDDFVEDKWAPPLDIGIVLYDGTEPLDLFGPLEMWMNMGVENIRVHLIAEEKRPIVLTTTSYPKHLAPKVEAQYSFEDAPDLDVLMVPGGIGTLVEVDNPAMIEFLKKTVPNVAVATSVCTGSALYAKAELLAGVKATGNKVFFDYLVSQGEADWQLEARWVESGRFLTSSGVSAGIDMSLAVIARFFGLEVARMVAASTEYEWNENADRDPFVKYANTATPFVEQLKSRFSASP
ncbi:MAG: DJ-1/PfpI family protein [Pseudomonadota bacterium]